MATRYGNLSEQKLESAEKFLNAAFATWTLPEHHEHAQSAAAPFITISREPGTGADLFSHRLAERLNQMDGSNWSAWDRELIEKVSLQHGINRNILDTLERRHGWLDDLLQSLSVSSTPDIDELRAYQKLVITIRALADAGRTIIVAEGSRFVTENMPGGLHLRLVAPQEHRIQHLADTHNLPLHKAAAQIVDEQQRRNGFYHQYWSGRSLTPETFTLTLNTAAMSADELIECVASIVRLRMSASGAIEDHRAA